MDTTTSNVIVKRIVENIGYDRRHLIRILQEIQREYGYLPRETLEEVSRILHIPLSDVLTVATFYHQFTLESPGLFTIWVCMGTACHLKGNAENYDYLRTILGLKEGEKTTKDKLFTVEKARCFGCCSLAPVIVVTGPGIRDLYGYVTPRDINKIIAKYRSLGLKKLKER